MMPAVWRSMISQASRERPEKHMTSEDLSSLRAPSESRSGLTMTRRRGRNSMKLEHSAKAAAYWSCLPPARLEIEPLDFERQYARCRIAPSGAARRRAEGIDQGDDQHRGRAEPRAQRRIDSGGDRRCDRLSTRAVAHHALVDAAVQQEPRLRQLRRRLQHVLPIQFLGAEHHLAVVAPADEGVGEAVDRRVEDRTAEFVAIGRQVGSPAGKAEPQRRAGADGRAQVRDHGRTPEAARATASDHLNNRSTSVSVETVVKNSHGIHDDADRITLTAARVQFLRRGTSEDARFPIAGEPQMPDPHRAAAAARRQPD